MSSIFPIFPRAVGALPFLASPPRFPAGLHSWGESGRVHTRAVKNMGRVWSETYNAMDAFSLASPRALLAAINRAMRRGIVWQVQHPYCWRDRFGVGGGAPAVSGGGGRFLRVSSAAPNVTGWLKKGDIISVEGAPVVYDVAADVDTNSGGGATIEISPPLFGDLVPEAGAVVEIDPENIYFNAVIIDVQEFPTIDPTRYIAAGLQLTWREHVILPTPESV
jgi:hypothetical protein